MENKNINLGKKLIDELLEKKYDKIDQLIGGKVACYLIGCKQYCVGDCPDGCLNECMAQCAGD